MTLRKKAEYIAAVSPEIRVLFEESLNLAYASGESRRSRRQSMMKRDQAMCMTGKIILTQQDEIRRLEAKLGNAADLVWPGLRKAKR